MKGFIGRLHVKRLYFNYRGVVTRKIAAVLLFIVIIVIWYWLGSSLLYVGVSNPPESETLRAAIIDGIYSTSPNKAFINEAVSYFKKANFTVDLYLGENATIKLLRNLPVNYRVVVLRVHSAIFQADHFIYLFSSELYREDQYFIEQTAGSVKKAYTFTEEGPYFALKGYLLSDKKPESLKDSLVILMGCNGTDDSVFINKLMERGIAAYVGWTGYVNLRHTDAATLFLLKRLCVDNLSLEEAAKTTMSEVGPDPFYGSVLRYFPEEGKFKLNSQVELFDPNRILYAYPPIRRIAKHKSQRILDSK